MQQMLAAGCGAVKEFALEPEIQAPGVATAGSDLFEGGAIGLEANDSGGDFAKILRAITGFGMTGAVADRAVSPTVHAPAKIIYHRVSIADAEPGVEPLDFVGFAVAIRVAEPKNVRRLSYDYAVLVKYEGRHQFQAFVKDMP